MEAKIDIISRDWIKPSSPTPQHRKQHKLSFLDQVSPFAFILFYEQKTKNSPDSSFSSSETSLHLKQSLSKCLSQFYPLAGKLNPDRFAVDCDDSGALFAEAKVNATLSQALNNAPYEYFSQFLPFVAFDDKGGVDRHCKLLGTFDLCI
ncbi:OLC1v1000178C1 [Oldenlandia corymbosa var. corymbosa]|uniref:OLC1v1000178C1 n=1 Tax=Oldenlandia corymbosa var. corymbosa TaxID=529605 RepID=A0AAV1D299_OLDCO|nr:OLC1v1000178C1 [Oldenlandia corymbosa var. corymbosa]